MQDRFIIRPDPKGFSIVDLRTGEAAEIAGTRQSALSREDADHMVGLLNTGAPNGDRAPLP